MRALLRRGTDYLAPMLRRALGWIVLAWIVVGWVLVIPAWLYFGAPL